MKKRIIVGILMMITILALSTSAFALTEGDWEFTLQNNEAIITDYKGPGGDIVVPSQLKGAVVTRLEGKVSGGYFHEATSISFPSSVKYIGEVCWKAKKLEKVTLDEGLEELDSFAFAECEMLKEITLPSTLKTIGTGAFEDCISLKKINIPEGLETIEGTAFQSSGLEEIDLGNSAPEIGLSAFAHCKNLKSANLGNKLTAFGERTFYGCTALTQVHIPNTVTEIDDAAFYGCSSLKNIVLPTSLKRLNHQCFRETGLIEVVIPYGTEEVWNVFSQCSSLEAVYIPDTVTSLGHGVISGSDNAIIYCSAGSVAEAKCDEYNISYLTDNSVNSEITVLYNDNRISFHTYEQNPVIIDGRTLVPLRAIFEAMQADVEWIGETSTAKADRGNVSVSISIGDNILYKGGAAISLDVPAQLINGRTMIPARAIAEAFGADVQWLPNGKTVLINE